MGVSACLLGVEVRHDGTHRRHRYLTEVLSNYFRYIPVCPEAEVGMGTPRPTVRLVAAEDGPRLVASRTGDDWTERMQSYATARADRIASLGLRGFVLKSRSPSCGMSRVKVYRPAGPETTGVGLFAEALMRRLPSLPVEEEGRLNDPRLRENFVMRVFVYNELLALREAPSAAGLMRFHARHKMLLLAHSAEQYEALGQVVAEISERSLDSQLEVYEAAFMAAIARPASMAGQVNVMQHLAGQVKDALDADDKQEFTDLLADYRAGRVPVAVPLTLLRHHLRRHGTPWSRRQSYLDPFPRSLGLRGRV